MCCSHSTCRVIQQGAVLILLFTLELLGRFATGGKIDGAICRKNVVAALAAALTEGALVTSSNRVVGPEAFILSRNASLVPTTQ